MRNALETIAAGTRHVLRALDRPVRRHRSRRPRGVALIVALVTIAVLAAAVTEYAYSSRVNLKMSVNAKDKVKSYFLARSAVNLSRLLLNFQYALQNEADEAENNATAGGSCNAGMISVAMRRSNFQMYQYMDLLMRPFNSGSLETPVGGINLNQAGVEGFGEVQGTFDVDIEPESGKFNVNRFAKQKIKQEDLEEFCGLVSDSNYTDVFRKDDENDQVLDRYRMLKYIADYIDLNETELPLTEYCTLEEGGSGPESANYDNFDLDIEPRNAKLVHISELYQVYGVSDPFMRAFEDKLTVYPVGKPNANMATFPVFYSILCRNTRLGNNTSVSASAQGFSVCQKSPDVALQVMYFAMALDGVRNFFKDPISVLMAYVGSTESRLLPSAKKGQPVAFLRSSQVHNYLEDFKQNPQLMARFITFSPAYRQIARNSRQFQIDPRRPNFPEWVVSFDRTGLIRAVTTQTPSIYRVRATGTYGSTKSTIETVLDFDKTLRRLPNEDALEERESDSEQLKELKEALQERRKRVPRGRALFWRENIMNPVEDSGESASEEYDDGEPTSDPEGENTEEGGEESGMGEQEDESSPGGSQFGGDDSFGGGGSSGEQFDDWNFDFDD